MPLILCAYGSSGNIKTGVRLSPAIHLLQKELKHSPEPARRGSEHPVRRGASPALSAQRRRLHPRRCGKRSLPRCLRFVPLRARSAPCRSSVRSYGRSACPEAQGPHIKHFDQPLQQRVRRDRSKHQCSHPAVGHDRQITALCPHSSRAQRDRIGSRGTAPVVSYSSFCSKKSTGSGSLIAAISSPLASWGLEGTTTLRPGT